MNCVACGGGQLSDGGNSNWRRVKKGLPQRYRLFFMLASNPLQVIIYAWLTDEDSLRKEGRCTDVYEVFKRMLERGEVPSPPWMS